METINHPSPWLPAVSLSPRACLSHFYFVCAFSFSCHVHQYSCREARWWEFNRHKVWSPFKSTCGTWRPANKARTSQEHSGLMTRQVPRLWALAKGQKHACFSFKRPFKKKVFFWPLRPRLKSCSSGSSGWGGGHTSATPGTEADLILDQRKNPQNGFWKNSAMHGSWGPRGP